MEGRTRTHFSSVFLKKGLDNKMDGKEALLALTLSLVALALLLRMRGAPLFGSHRSNSPDTSLGVAGEGVHKSRLFGVALFDMMGAIVMSVLLAWISKGSLTAWLIVVLIASEVQHYLYGIPTPTQKWLFDFR